MINDFRPTRPTATSRPTAQTTAIRPPNFAPRRPYILPRQASTKPRWWWRRLQLVALGLVVLAGGFVTQTLALGIALLAAYGVAAVALRIPSRTTFTLALMLLVAISVMLLIKPNQQLINNFATYAFMLLVVGVITLGRESKMPRRMRRNYQR